MAAARYMISPPSLIGAPYEPPACHVGDWLDDEIDGRLQVGGWTAAPIPWPRRKKTGRPSLILTDDLARAVRTESVDAICHWWGVRPTKVWMWRRALGVGRITDGTRALLQERTGVPAAAAARGRAKAAEPASRAKMAATKRGRPAHPSTKAALLFAARRRKGAVWGVKANAAMLRRSLPPLHHNAWTAEEDALLLINYGRRPAAAIGVLLGRSVPAVYARALQLGIAKVRPKSRGRRIGGKKRWTAADDRLLQESYRTSTARALALQLGRTPGAVVMRAHIRGLRKR